jgi:hypothetical protein
MTFQIRKLTKYKQKGYRVCVDFILTLDFENLFKSLIF